MTNAAADVYPISTASGRAGRPIFFGYNGYGPSDASTALAITPNGRTVYELAYSPINGGPGAVMPISTSTNAIGSPIAVGPDPYMIVIARDGRTGYVIDQVGNP